MAVFSARHHVSTATICTWRRGLRAHGEAGLRPKSPRRNAGDTSGPGRSPEERRRAVDAFEGSDLTLQSLALTYGVSRWTMRTWLKRFHAEGPKGLESRPRGRWSDSGGLRRVPEAVRDEIARTRSRVPEFGLKKVRDFLPRFEDVSVSTGTVARTLEERGVEPSRPMKKRRRKTAVPRRLGSRPIESKSKCSRATHFGRWTKPTCCEMKADNSMLSPCASAWRRARWAFRSARPRAEGDVARLPQQVAEQRGARPLVIQMDNGPENKNADVEACLREARVVMLWNEPRTPQHNPLWIGRR
jgi:transposase